MSETEMVRKLMNAVRDLHGRRGLQGQWFRRPNPSARPNVERWIWRLEKNGVVISDAQKQTLLNPKTV